VRLTLINDLPLYRACTPGASDKTLAAAAARLSASAPATVELVPFAALEAWWEALTAGAGGDAVLVGDRPARLAKRHGTGPLRAIVVRPVRVHGDDGRTASVELDGAALAPALRGSRDVLIVDDVLMSGATARRVHDAVLGVAEDACVRLALFVASEPSLARLLAERPALEVRCERTLPIEPVAEGTALFVRDLLDGAIGDRPLLERDDLLAPLLGPARAPIVGFCETARRVA
jgi:hypothetical protein